jgi:heme/copper-type cytochrome/quinol oxidase subunit 4
MEYLAYILGIFTTVFAVASMQFKDMKYVLVCQLICNSILTAQYVIEDRVSVSGVVILAVIQTIVRFFFDMKHKPFPVWLTCVFIVGFTVVSIVMMKSPYDLITCAAVWFYAICVVQKRSSVARICSTVNTVLWLIYDILCAPSAVVTHAVILVFIIAGIIRLDREDWKLFFSKIFGKGEKNAEKIEN